jgi:hypothetical protein
MYSTVNTVGAECPSLKLISASGRSLQYIVVQITRSAVIDRLKNQRFRIPTNNNNNNKYPSLKYSDTTVQYYSYSTEANTQAHFRVKQRASNSIQRQFIGFLYFFSQIKDAVLEVVLNC